MISHQQIKIQNRENQNPIIRKRFIEKREDFEDFNGKILNISKNFEQYLFSTDTLHMKNVFKTPSGSEFKENCIFKMMMYHHKKTNFERRYF